MQRTWLNVIKKHLFYALLFIAIVVTDQVTKRIIANIKPQTELIKGLLSFHYTENEGAAFSFLHDKSWAQTFFLIITIIAVAVFILFYLKTDIKYKLLRCSLALITAGAVGNFIDRLIYKFVVDFISIHFFPAIFNVADIALTFGAIFFVYHYLFLDKDAIIKRKIINEDNKPNAAEESGEEPITKQDIEEANGNEQP